MNPYYEQDGITIYHGDCREVMPEVEAIALITDPPYGSDEHGGYGRRQLGLQSIENDSDTIHRDAALDIWGNRPAAVFSSPRKPPPPGEWSWVLVWDKGRPGLGSPWRWAHELIFVRGDWENTPGVPSVLRFPAPPSMREANHPHEKPQGLLAALIRGAPEGTILDPFMGSGTTLRAAKDLGRQAIGIEISEKYCEVAAKRLEQGVLFPVKHGG